MLGMDYTKYTQFELRRKFWKFFGAAINITDPVSGQRIGFIKMKAWKLREDVRLYTDETLTTELMAIHARQIIDFGATYDVTDSQTGEALFSLKRKGLRSTFVRDKWEILDTSGAVIGQILETSGWLALLRRWLSMINDLLGLIFAFVPETYDISLSKAGEQPQLAARIVHRKNPFIVKMNVDLSVAAAPADPRLSLASAALLSIIDASKNA